MLAHHAGGHGVALFDLPVAGLHAHHGDVGGLHGVLVAQGALLRIEGGGHAFDDAHLVARLQRLGQVVAHQLGACTVVGADKGHGDVLFLQRIGIELVVDVDHEDALVDGRLDHGHQRLGVGRGQHDGADLLRHGLFDHLDLRCRVGLVLDAVGHQRVFLGMGLLVRLGAVFHGAEELVGQRLHDERDLGLVLRKRRAGQQAAHNGEGGGGLNGTAGELHGCCLQVGMWTKATLNKPLAPGASLAQDGLQRCKSSR